MVLFEFTRGAVNPFYRYKGLVVMKMFLKAFEDIRLLEGSIITTSSLPNVQSVLAFTGAQKLNFEFKFEERDPSLAQIFFFDNKRIENYIKSTAMKIEEIESILPYHKSRL
jgi:hypothetical protein